MSTAPSPAGAPPTPAATPPVVANPPPVVSPVASPPIATPPVTVPPAAPPVATPPVVTPPPPVAAPPPVVTTPPVAAPPPVATSPPPVATPPPVAAPPPVVTTPPVAAPPPAATPPPPVSPPPQVNAPPPATQSPPPPATQSPPPPATQSPPPPANSPPPPPGSSPPPPPGAAPPPTVVITPPGSNKSPPPPALNPPPAASGPSSSSSKSGMSSAEIGGIAAGAGFVALLALVLLLVLCRKRKNRKNVLPYAAGGGGAATAAAYKAGGMDPKGYVGGGNARLPPGSYGGTIPLPPEGSPSVGNSRSWFTYEELHAATNGFAIENLLGEGGFGRVYKGELPNGQVVAVKQLTIGGGQGDREFRAEVEIISRVHHRHLVSLVGYCIADKQRLLVYDFVPNGTLDVNLYGKGRPVMSWEMRLRVALGAARGLAYLHEDCHPRIIHRDIKSSNILLDDKYEAQVADFGLAKLASDTNTHVSTRVMGTFGYLAPEYAQSGKLTEKSDVYSFGVMLLELITGRKPIDQRNPVGQESLVEWARPLMTYAMEDGDLDELVDPRLDGHYDSKEVFRMIEVAASCVRHTASKRPKMGQVVRALESEEDNAGLYTFVRPGMSSEHESDFDRYAGSDYNTQAYNADMLRSRKPGASTKSYGSEYTNEYTSGQIDRGSSSEFDPIIPKAGETRVNVREPGPISVRTGRSSMPSVRGGRSTENYTSLPPTRAAPPRPGQLTDSDQSGSIRSDMFVPPPPPPDYSEEYAPIDFNSSIRNGR